MDSQAILFWLIFSIVLGILYFRFTSIRSSLSEERRQGPLEIGRPATALRSYIKDAIGGLATRMFGGEQTAVENREEGLGQAGVDAAGKWHWFEWLVIVVPIGVYCFPFLNLGTALGLPGPEAEYFQTFDQILEISIKKYGQFPLWNPYFLTGSPYVAHPMLHVYNPFISLPVLLFGALDGFKIAVFLGFLIAGLGMWWLGKEVGLGRVGRVWCALMFAFCGVPASKFIQGHYLLVLALGWIPFSLAALMAALRTRKRSAIGWAALALAMLFFCGNGYYAYYMLYVIAIFAAVSATRLKIRPFSLGIDAGKLKTSTAVGLLTLGLIAVQLLPLIAFRNQYIKGSNTLLTDSQGVKDVFLDFVSPEPFRAGAVSGILRPEEFYAYTGWWPFLGMLFLPFVRGKRSKRQVLFFLILIVFVFAWIDIKDVRPWRILYRSVAFFYQFRYPTRMVAVGAMSLIIAGGLGVDTLWDEAKRFSYSVPAGGRRNLIAGSLLTLALGSFMVGSLYDLEATSRPLLATIRDNSSQQPVMAWLRAHDPGIYFVNTQNNWHRAMIGNELRYLNIWDAIMVQPDWTDQISDRKIVPLPKYLVQPNNVQAPDNASLIKSFEHTNIYQADESLPFAFTLSTGTLTTPSSSDLRPDEVTPVKAVSATINDLEVVADRDSKGALIVLSSFSPDWQLTVDGQPAKVFNAYGFLAADAEPGVHHFLFSYRPSWFFAGLTISLLSLSIVGVLLFAKSGQRNAK